MGNKYTRNEWRNATMTTDIHGIFRSLVSAKLKAAIKRQDKQSAHALRAVLHAVDNASAVQPTDPVDLVPSGPGAASDVVGRVVGRDLIAHVLTSEAEARKRASREYEQLGRAEEAQRFGVEAEIIQLCLKELDDFEGKAG